VRLLLLFLPACAPSVEVKSPEPGGGSSTGDGHQTAVLATVSEDYATGAVATVSLDDWAVTDTLFDTSGDPAVVAAGDWVFQLDRFSHNTVRTYAPGQWAAPVAEWSLPSAANPHDVAICGGEAVLTEYDTDQLSVWDPDRGLLLGTVDLSGVADSDGIPEASTAVVGANGRLYLGAHHFDRDNSWEPVGGALVEVDCEARAVTQHWELPTPDVHPHPGGEGLLVTARDGSVRRFDPQAGTLSDNLLAEPAPGDIVGFAAFAGRAVLITSDDEDYAVHCADLTTGALSLIEARDNFLISAQANDRGEVWVAARTHWSDPGGAIGTLVYDAESCSALTEDGPIQTLLAPYSIAFY
jgi:hypothetical protein